MVGLLRLRALRATSRGQREIPQGRNPLGARLAVGCAVLALAAIGSIGLPAGVAQATPSGLTPLWNERFERSPLGWADPAGHSLSELKRVYSVREEGNRRFLHALHQAVDSGAPKAMHYGQGFRDSPILLSQIRHLKWKWRVLQHPGVEGDPWVDLAASVYVVTRIPSVLPGKGFKFGWLAKPGARDTKQRGLLQIQLRTDAAGPEWREETVDICGLYRRHFGPCEDQPILYVGVVTDADGTRSTAEADYADFQLVPR